MPGTEIARLRADAPAGIPDAARAGTAERDWACGPRQAAISFSAMRRGPNGWRAAAFTFVAAAACCTAGCAAVKVTYQPPSQAQQPTTDLAPESRQQLREAAKGTEDELALVAIKLAEAGPGTAPGVAAYVAEIRPAAAPFVRSTLMAMFPDEASEIAIAVSAALPTSQSLAPPPRSTGHTFFNWP